MRIPTATYRLQFNKEFTFRDATEIVPYLAALGISHCYASPFLQARQGSMHGYDIINHKKINSEIGSREEFDRFVETLRAHNMGLIGDFVPNHMGVDKDNPWWMDVLENGPASPYAEYFDIDWQPVRQELYGKVLIPVLGSPYGDVLRNGELIIVFDIENGTLRLNYYDHSFPLNPVSYPQILGLRLHDLRDSLDEDSFDLMEYQSILSALERLPDHLQPVGHAQRVREKKVQQKRLAMLAVRNSVIAAFIRENMQMFQVQGADEETIERLHALLEAQAYRLSYWRVASDEINYRRFFDINDLAAIRTEDVRVFNDIHSLMLDLVEAKQLDGLRIDHPDGLFDPAVYFRRLQSAAARRLKINFDPQKHTKNINGGAMLPLYVVAEKILAPFENIEDDWLVQGTTGYDFLDSVNNLLVAEENEESFTEIYTEFCGKVEPYDEQKRHCKNLILRTVLASELNMLAHRLDRIAESNLYYRDFTLSSLRRALRAVVAHFPVYRTYANLNGAGKTVEQYVDWAITLSKRHGDVPGAVFDFIRNVLLMDLPLAPGETSREVEEPLWQSIATFAMKFQQFTGPVTAKSVEDTLFYRYNRMVCLNEVGGEPKRFGTSISSFHKQNLIRQSRTPYGLLATSTHDTKRSEDVRARLAVVSEMPMRWKGRVAKWSRLSEKYRRPCGEELAPDRNDEYLIFQTIVGAMPLSPLSSDEELSSFRDRIIAYMVKCMREAKVHSSWVEQHQEYEEAVSDYIASVLTRDSDNEVLSDIEQFVQRISGYGTINSLVHTLLKVGSPGIPDIYQGNELWDFSLVDPDNRRLVDYKHRQQMLSSMENILADPFTPAATERTNLLRKMFRDPTGGQLKMLVCAAGLHVRRSNPKLFDAGEYIPLNVVGKCAAHVIAFARRRGDDWAVIAAPVKLASLVQMLHTEHVPLAAVTPLAITLQRETWADSYIEFPESFKHGWAQSVFTARRVNFDKQQIAVADLFQDFPVALLVTPKNA